jgi:hypothetical protein
MEDRWLKLNDWRKVHFPEVCPYTGLQPDTHREFVVDDSSWLWRGINVFLRFGQYITLQVPYHTNGIKELKKLRFKAVLKGLLIGLGVALLFMVGGVALAVEYRTDAFMNRMGIMGGGIGFLVSLIAFPVWLDYRVRLSMDALRMRKKQSQLWVKIKNSDYRKKFIILNDFMLIPDDKDSTVLDKDFV